MSTGPPPGSSADGSDEEDSGNLALGLAIAGTVLPMVGFGLYWSEGADVLETYGGLALVVAGVVMLGASVVVLYRRGSRDEPRHSPERPR